MFTSMIVLIGTRCIEYINSSSKVTVASEAPVFAHCTANKTFMASLPPHAASDPELPGVEVTITDGKTTITLKDVLFGQFWH